ncbi:hypothetical protein ACH4TE_25110 [Streptomyces sioyaensis]|uniref:hypothetical protein n=1 Tax=Streptomyces sioyaensis TaxID=67364 RepID=UPI0037AB74B8
MTDGMGEGNSTGSGNQSRVNFNTKRLAWCIQLGVPLAGGVGALIATLFLVAYDLPATLIAATLTLSAIIFLYLLATLLWVHLANQGPIYEHPEVLKLAPAMTGATQLAVTVQGVVLGLIFAFLKNHSAIITIQVGAVSLVVGAILGLLLYMLAAYDVEAPGCRIMAGLLFNLTIWSAGYGLACVACSLFDRPLAATQ